MKTLDAANTAKRDAAHGDPPPGASGCPFLDDVRLQIEDVAKHARRQLEDYLKSIVAQAKATASAPGALLGARDTTLAEMRRVVDGGINETGPLADRVRSVNQEYTEFVVANDLVGRAADQNKTRVWWVIGFSATFELLVNGWTLGTAHPSGFIGVLSEILLFSAINVVFGLFAGAAMRRTNYRPKHSFRSVRAWAILAACLVFVLTFSFVFGHYRDALVGLQSRIAEGDYETYIRLWETLFRTALATAFSADWIPQTMQTVVLIFAGWLISGVVALEWYRSDDRYPGFGPMTRKREQAQNRYTQTINRLSLRNHELAENATEEMTGIVVGVVAATQLPNDVAACQQSYEDLIADLNRFGKGQLDKYRRASRQLKAWPRGVGHSVQRAGRRPEHRRAAANAQWDGR